MGFPERGEGYICIYIHVNNTLARKLRLKSSYSWKTKIWREEKERKGGDVEVDEVKSGRDGIVTA